MAIAQRFNTNNSAVNGATAGTNLSLNDILPLQPISKSTASADEKATIGQAQAIPYGTANLSGVTYTVQLLNYPNTFNLYVGSKFLVKFNNAYTGGNALFMSIGGKTIPMMMQGSALKAISANQIIEFTLYGTIANGTHTIAGANASAGVTDSQVNSALTEQVEHKLQIFGDLNLAIPSAKDKVLHFTTSFQPSNRPNTTSNYFNGFSMWDNNTSYIIQNVYSLDGKIYTRTKVSESWGNWQQLATESSVNTTLTNYAKYVYKANEQITQNVTKVIDLTNKVEKGRNYKIVILANYNAVYYFEGIMSLNYSTNKFQIIPIVSSEFTITSTEAYKINIDYARNTSNYSISIIEC